ncbi:squalene epoxidase-like protein [Vararia minispora EC-137]|uniref:Squalene epoxidase-like protein n=1 Tax=Vararia minispora EC-137 TaxID=1314806 RepID=A0ACB8QFP3_9AGAM|nr:squalene epoxidase-like protein [Vararia minispora EC-137]
MHAQSPYDILIVGAGAAGTTLAQALSRGSAARPTGRYRIALLERSLAEPDRIVGELLQPGGREILQRLGMGDCVEGIDAVPVHGYAVVKDGDAVRIPYNHTHEGRSFHHGRFIQNLRSKARTAPGVEIVEATVTDLIECPLSRRVIGVQAVRKGATQGEKEPFYATLVVVADGCFSNFRAQVYRAKPATNTVGHFVGVVLQDAALPIPKHGTVSLIRGHGPVLLYQIAEHDTRMLVDVKAPLPADLKSHILTEIVPHLPAGLQQPARRAVETDRLRRMPNTVLAPATQGGRATKEGVVLVGDAWNMRHPLTGGGMTVAFHDAELLARLLVALPDLGDWDAVGAVLHRWHWQRKPLAATVNILSVALYDLFGADDEYLAVLRDGCFAYFERGGTCVSEPVGLLSATRPDTFLLFYHFFCVAFYSIYVMFTRPRTVRVPGEKAKTLPPPGVEEYPLLCLKGVRVFWTACVVFGPLLWAEYRWW